jgi:UDP-N-acetylglucosamine 2-epimerase
MIFTTVGTFSIASKNDLDDQNLLLATVHIEVSTGCLMKNASTHNFFIYYPISMNEKIKDMVLQALQNSHKIYFFWRYLQ